jgi:hypothetical protein
MYLVVELAGFGAVGEILIKFYFASPKTLYKATWPIWMLSFGMPDD